MTIRDRAGDSVGAPSHTRLRLGVSSCLLGENVRYDGGHRRSRFLADDLHPYVEWVGVCPEVELGLEVPRGPIQLLRKPGGRYELWTRDTRQDLTARMQGWADQRLGKLPELDGFVLKHRSPSCGISGARVFEDLEALFGDGPYERTGRGLWAAALVERFPDLPIADESTLDDRGARTLFVRRVLARHRRRVSDPIDTIREAELMRRAEEG
jgi:uncharacterized protein YbbK (DUF523 family)